MIDNNIYEKFVIELYNSKFITLEDFVLNKKRIFGRAKINPPSNSEILEIYNHLVDKKIIERNKLFEKYCKKHKIRTLSGVSVISILTEEAPCPGNCAFCPSEKDMPKSYLPNEPAVMRAIKCNFDAYKQVVARLSALKHTGHDTSKNEIIIMGGTWSYLNKKYQEKYILNVFKGLNFDINKLKFIPLLIQEKLSKNNIKKIQIEQKINEKANNRCVGLTLETRPDYINEEELKRMRLFGCTRIEIGVQSTFDDVLNLNRRGHNIEKTIEATRLMKDAGFKICYHMMPNLPGSNLDKDYKMFYDLYN
ncbi:MAG TPA: radical SAM protein, partial [bacterium]|nr:radical SAM protein [bacterium]